MEGYVARDDDHGDGRLVGLGDAGHHVGRPDARPLADPRLETEARVGIGCEGGAPLVTHHDVLDLWGLRPLPVPGEGRLAGEAEDLADAVPLQHLHHSPRGVHRDEPNSAQEEISASRWSGVIFYPSEI